MMEKLTKEEIEAVEVSIKHWEKDIIEPLKRGDKIIKIAINTNSPYSLFWRRKKTNKEVKCFSSDCPLCKMVGRKGKEFFGSLNCHKYCPYYYKYSESCEQAHWSWFIKQPCLKTAKAMVKALKNILPKKNEKEGGVITNAQNPNNNARGDEKEIGQESKAIS